MKNHLIIWSYAITLLISGLFLGYDEALAYDDATTHPALTDEIVDFYNFSDAKNKLTSEQKEWVIEGSILEDQAPRWINHFYDPINKSGWTGAKTGSIPQSVVQTLSFIGLSSESPLSAVEWVNNFFIQQEYSLYGGNRTWRKALEYYADGNFKEAYVTLGYVLHLLEDMSVPDHTRDDTHAQSVSQITGDLGSPYEQYAARYNRSNIKDLNISKNLEKENIQPIVKSSINEYLISLAEYSNKYFFSKDTINDPKYQFPKIVREDENFGYGVDENGKEFQLVKIKEISLADKTSQKFYILESSNNSILDAYFSRLSRQAVLRGAGLIQLFNQKAAEAVVNKEFPVHLVKYDFSQFTIPIISFAIEGYKLFNNTISFIAQVGNAAGDVTSSIKNFFTGIFITDQNFKLADEINIDQNQDLQINQNLAGTTENNSNSKTTSASSNKKTSKKNKQNSNAGAKSELPKASDVKANDNKDKTKINEEDKTTEPEPETGDQQVKNEETGSKNEGVNPLVQVSSPSRCSFSSSQSPSHQGLIINEVAWMGTTESANNVWVELKNISNSAIDAKSFQLIDKGEKIKINLGSINRAKIGPGEFILLERTDDTTVSGIAADLIYFGSLSNTNEGLRLFDNKCNLVDEALANPDWVAGDNAVKKTMERDKVGFGWHTSNIIGGTPKGENSEPTSIYNGGGGGGSISSSNQQPSSNNQSQSPSKILITEVQITGGSGKTNNDFIELYNPNLSPINLNGYRLVKRTKNGTKDTSIKSWTGDVFIGAHNYYLWANSDYTNIPVGPDSTTSATLANDNGIAIRFGPEDSGAVIDSVAWGEAQNTFIESSVFKDNPGVNQSIQRKIENNAFVDTDNNSLDFEIHSCPSPKSQLRTCQALQSNEALNSLTTSTIATSTILSDASSTPSKEVNHILISEVMPGAGLGHADEEFIELYNPTNKSVSLSGWHLKRKSSSAATSTQTLVQADGLKDKVILAKSFLLIASPEYQGEKIPDIKYSHSYRLSYTNDVVILYSNNNEAIDEVSYEKIESGKSLERKAFSTDFCASAQSSGEFIGNGCDTDNISDFEIRDNPNPQNSESLPEPRSAPTTPANFNIAYSSNSMQLGFNWQISRDFSGATSSIIYKVKEYPDSETVVFNGTSTGELKISIDEVGRDYHRSIQSFDKDGLGSEIVSSTIAVPSPINSLYFYRASSTSTNYSIEAYYNKYPFIPDLFSQNPKWKVLVLYLNKAADKGGNFYEGIAPVLEPADLNSVVGLKFRRCSGGSISAGNSLILPDESAYCGSNGGTMNSSLDFGELEDNHFLITTASSTSEAVFTPSDYVTLAYYSPYDWSMGRGYGFKLVAVDRTKFHFQNSVPSHQAPEFSGELSISFDKGNSKLNINWPKAKDSDTLDYLLNYEIRYYASGDWQSIGHVTGTQKIVSPGDNLKISVRVRDDWDNISGNILKADWSYPEAKFYIKQIDSNDWSPSFGYKDGLDNAASVFQSITPESDFQFNKVVLKVKHMPAEDSADLKLSLYPTAGNGQPDLGALQGSSMLSGILSLDGTEDITFSFANSISLIANNKYWLFLEVSKYNWQNNYDQWRRNAFETAVSNLNPYLGGESGKYIGGAFSFDSNKDWYMKIGLEPQF